MKSFKLRTAQILQSVDELLWRIHNWASGSLDPTAVHEDVRCALRHAMAICDEAVVPPVCRTVATVGIGRLAEEFRGYDLKEDGRIRHENGAPGPSFWAAVAALAKARFAASVAEHAPLEPVSVLLKQGISPTEIACHIYGRNGTGPFLCENGEADLALIEQESRRPGSVVATKWIPPWTCESRRQKETILADQLRLFARMESAEWTDDPVSVEELLQRGACVQQIERTKGISRARIHNVAARIRIAPIDQSGFRTQSVAARLDSVDGDDASHGASTDRAALRELVIRKYQESGARRGAAEIAAELRQRGHNINTTSAAAMIGHWKRNRTNAVAVEPAAPV